MYIDLRPSCKHPPCEMSDAPPRGNDSKLVRDDSKRKLAVGEGDAGRRSRFKERSRDLERGTSATSLPKQDSFGALPSRAPLPISEEEALTVGESMGHEFEKKTFFQPTYCHHCSELLWGIRGQGFHCKGEKRQVAGVGEAVKEGVHEAVLSLCLRLERRLSTCFCKLIRRGEITALSA